MESSLGCGRYFNQCHGPDRGKVFCDSLSLSVGIRAMCLMLMDSYYARSSLSFMGQPCITHQYHRDDNNDPDIKCIVKKIEG